MAQVLVDIADPTLIESGIIRSVNKLTAPLWIDGDGVLFKEFSVQKAPGYSAAFTKLDSKPIRGAQQIIDANTKKLYYGDQDNLYRWQGVGASDEISKVTGGYTGDLDQNGTFPASFWSTVPWGTWVLFSNNKDPIQINKGTGNFADLAGTPPVNARIIRRIENFVIAFNTDLGPTYSEWTATDDVEDWVSGNAGNLNIRHLDSEIIAAELLGTNRLAVYSRNQMAFFNFINIPFIFGAKEGLKGIGAISTDCVIAVGRKNYGISRQGIWGTDGSSFAYIDEPAIQKWLQDNVDWSQASKITGAYNQVQDQLEWGIPTINGGGEIDITLAYRIKNKTFTFIPQASTTRIERDIFDNPFWFDTAGETFLGEFGVNANGQGKFAFARSKPFVGIATTRNGQALLKNNIKEMRWIEPVFDRLAGTGVRIRVGVQRKLTDAITWTNQLEVTESAAPIYFLLAAGVYFTVEVSSSALDDDWQLSSFKLFGDVVGEVVDR